MSGLFVSAIPRDGRPRTSGQLEPAARYPAERLINISYAKYSYGSYFIRLRFARRDLAQQIPTDMLYYDETTSRGLRSLD